MNLCSLRTVAAGLLLTSIATGCGGAQQRPTGRRGSAALAERAPVVAPPEPQPVVPPPPLVQPQQVAEPVASLPPAPEPVARDAFGGFDAGTGGTDAARDAFRSGDLTAAASALRGLPPGLSSAAQPYAQGVIAYYRGDEARAVQLFESAMERDPAYAPPVAALVRLALARGDTSGARSLVERRRQASQDAPTIGALSLYVDLAERQYEAVIRNGHALLLRDEKNLDAFFCIASANLALGRADIARYIADQGIERDPNRADFYFLKAQIELTDGRPSSARTFFRRVVELDPNHPEAQNNLGVLLMRSRDFEGAISAFEAATRSAPRFAGAWNNLGSAYKGAQRYDEAKTAFEKALSLSASDPGTLFNLGLLYYDAEFGGETKLSRMEKAADFFERHIRAAGSGPDARAQGLMTEARNAVKIEEQLKSQGGTNSGTSGESPGGDDPAPEPTQDDQGAQ